MLLQSEINYSGARQNRLSVCLNIFLKVSFALFLLILIATNLHAAQVAEFDTKFEIVACFEKKGCTNVDLKPVTHQVTFAKVPGFKDDPRFVANIEVNASGHDQKYSGHVNILRHRMGPNWVYTFTVYLKDEAEKATIIRTRDFRQVNGVVLHAKPRKVGKEKTVKATFYFGPPRTDLF